MKNMSFFLTTHQMKKRTKTVTRRLGWGSLEVGNYVMACVKCQGLGSGGKIERIWPLKITGIGREPLNTITHAGCVKEGFSEMSPRQFVDMFCKHNKCTREHLVNVIEFEFSSLLDSGATGAMSDAQWYWWMQQRDILLENPGH